jgi:hypothetical protein
MGAKKGLDCSLIVSDEILGYLKEGNSRETMDRIERESPLLYNLIQYVAKNTKSPREIADIERVAHIVYNLCYVANSYDKGR